MAGAPPQGTESIPHRLGLRAGDEVEVRSQREILSTLDENGRLDAVPFMPEMLPFCGKRFRVSRRADKVCDTVTSNVSRRLHDTVFLENLRCDGSAHDGCQAGCLIFWKEAWLRRPDAREAGPAVQARLNRDDLVRLTRRPRTEVPSRAPHRLAVPGLEATYVCQVTQLSTYGPLIRWWHPLPYLRELYSGNVRLGVFVRSMAISWFNAVQRLRGGRTYPWARGTLVGATPARRLDLKPGERVRVRPVEEILETLEVWGKNRGMAYDPEMVPYSGGEYRVARRVNRIIHEPTGRMIAWSGDCIVLEGVVCKGCLSRNRMFCGRSIFAYWREIWLERVEEAQ